MRSVFRFNVIGSVLALAFALVPVVSVWADAPASQPGEWGKECNGLVAGLRLAKPAVEVGQPIMFKVEVRNPGNTETSFPYLGGH
jgi:hypothetical protein